MRKQWAWCMFSGLVLIVLLYPERLTVVPAYHVLVVDQFGAPMAHTGVSELWQLASVHRVEHLEQVMTNSQGVADLPARTVRASLAERMLGCLAYLSREGMGAVCGNHFSINGAGDLEELERAVTTTGLLKPQHSLVLTLQHCDPADPMLC
jgi:hypothetical protein